MWQRLVLAHNGPAFHPDLRDEIGAAPQILGLRVSLATHKTLVVPLQAQLHNRRTRERRADVVCVIVGNPKRTR